MPLWLESETLNQPANITIVVKLIAVGFVLEMPELIL
jgi:hypothetical protein